MLSHSSWTADWHFPEQKWRTGTIYSFPHIPRHFCHTNVHTHLESLHGFTWRAGAQPAAAAKNPSSHFSVGSLSTVHPFAALLLKCVCVREHGGVNVRLSRAVMCQKIKWWRGELHALKDRTTEQMLLICRVLRPCHIMSPNRPHL